MQRLTGVRPGALAAALAAAGVLAGCDAPTDPDTARARAGGPSMLITPACAGTGGQTHAAGYINSAQTWSRASSPHRVTGWIYVDFGGRLTVAPGAAVCFEPGSGIIAQNGGRVLARGRDTAQVLLTARDPARGWSGVHVHGTPGSASYLTNVRIEYVAVANVAASSAEYHPLILDSALIRQSGQAVSLQSPSSRLSRSRVDTTTNRAAAAVDLGNGATFEKSTVRRAAGVGVRVSGPNVSLVGGRIEGSGGTGLQVLWPGQPGATMQAVRVVNGRSYGAELSAEALVRLYPGPGQQDSIRGNARDTVIVTGGTLRRQLTVGPRLPVRIASTVYVDSAGVLTALPGALLAFEPYAGLHAQNGGRVSARGTAASRVLFTADDPARGWQGLYFSTPGTTASYLTNVQIEHVDIHTIAVTAYDYHRVILDSAVIRRAGAAASLHSSNSRISRTRVDTTFNADIPAVELGSNAKIESTRIRASSGTGLRIAGSAVQVVSCEVREGDGVGIDMYYPVAVHNCNLVNNLGLGIHNLGAGNADVRNNWWGGSGGPAGAGGDGSAGPLVFSPWRTTPFVLPYVP